MQYSAERLFLEIATIATKVYATSSVILFCIASLAIANQFDNIRNQVEQNMNLFNDTADILMRLQSQYSSGKKTNMNIFFTVFVFFIISLTKCTVCRSVKKLNYCFGFILLIEISYNFLSIISSSMEFLINKGQISWQLCLQLAIFMNNLMNLLAICFSAESLRTKVLPFSHFIHNLSAVVRSSYF